MPRKLLPLVLASAAAALLAITLAHDAESDRIAAESIRQAADAFLATLDPDQRTRVSFDFESEERFNWHYFPREREGLPLGAMTLDQRRAGHDLLRETLSAQGYLKASGVMQMEALLYELEDRSERRNPENYFFSVFGDPSGPRPWGWRVEGHHLSFNYTDVYGPEVSVTPAFLGSNPAEVREGPHAGFRVLGGEEEAGRALMRSLDESQGRRATIAAEAPSDIVTGADRKARLERFEGIPASELRPDQHALLLEVIRQYTHNLRPDLAEAKLRAIEAAGLDSLYFGWAGGLERGEPHYFRIHAPAVVFEYDNVQNGANHAHAVWREFDGDFGEDLLRRHHDEAH